MRSLFLRTVNIFPPPGLDVRDNFFSIQREPTEKEFGRRYLGICTPGRHLKAALIRVYFAYLCFAQSLYEKYGKHVDPWMTLVGYFNSMRELGGMRRLVDDDVFSRCRKQDRRGLAKRFFSGEYLAELTTRGFLPRLFVFPETSCERGNKYLDRSAVVQTVERTNLAFFG